jgi:predicted Zn-dependent peptidase
MDEIYAVKKADIDRVIAKYIDFDECTQVVVGPVKKASRK